MPTTDPIVITPSTSVVLVNTADFSGNPIVLLPNVDSLGRIITIRDADGGSLTKPIYISTTGGALFQQEISSVTISSLVITQPYGFYTITPRLTDIGGTTRYGIMNAFAFRESSDYAYVNMFNANMAYTSTLSTVNLEVHQDLNVVGNINVTGSINYTNPGSVTFNADIINTRDVNASTIRSATTYASTVYASSIYLANTLEASTLRLISRPVFDLSGSGSWSNYMSGGTDPNSMTLGDPDAGAGAQIATDANFFGIRTFNTTSANFSTTVIARDGNVGINLPYTNLTYSAVNPNYNLAVKGALRLSNYDTRIQQADIIFKGDGRAGASNVYVNAFAGTNAQYNTYSANNYTQGFYTSGNGYQWVTADKGATYPETIKFWTGNNVERMRIDSAGNVGIGKVPTVGLDVAGQIRTDSSIVLADGSVGTPAINFTTDTNTGLYHPLADTIGVVTAGSERVRVDSAGKVGIGKTPATYQLEVSGNAQIIGTAGDGLRVGNSTSDARIFLQPNTGGNYTEIKRYDGANGNFDILNGGTGQINISAKSTDYNGISLLNNGRVGLGKTNPSFALDVSGQIKTDNSIVIPDGSVAAPALNFGAGTGTDTNTGIYHPADNTIGVVINGSETARFTGTSFAAQAMSTVTLSTATITAGQGTAGAPSYTFNGDGDTGVYSPAANTVAVTTGGSERMRIDSAGNVGIGTAADASYKLDVTNDSRFRNALFVTPATSGLGTIRLTTDAGQSYIQSGSNTGSSSNKLYFTGIFGVNTTMVADMVNQRVRIGGGTDPTVALDVTGQIKTDNSILLGNGSAAAPSMTFTSDTNTGIYRNAENELSLSTDGAERLRVGLSEQRMYFGEAGGAYTSFAKDNITIGQGRTGNDFAYLDLVGDISNTDYGLRLLRGNVGSNSGSELSHRGTGNLTINASDAAPILFQTQSLERLRITSDGNVGVGTASPGSYKLNVNGNTNVTGDLNVTGNITGSSSVMPAGSITAYGGSSAPTGWLLCNGSAVSRTTYAALFTAISSNYGNGDGVNTFNVPNIGDRFPIGKGSDVSSNTLGYTSGSKTHTLTTAEIPSHSHTQQRITAGYAASFNSNEEVFSVSRDNGIEPFTTGSAGGGGAHNNMPPYIVVNYIIKT